jgi:UDP-3-O-[3-hydroxymyristoyl] glucosamine N-acyltransferase
VIANRLHAGADRLSRKKGRSRVNVTVRQLAALVRGEVSGDAEAVITSARPLSAAQPGDITFVEDDRHAAKWRACQASAAVVPATLPVNGRTVIRVEDPITAFVTIVRHLHGTAQPEPPGIDPRAAVHAAARVGPDATIMLFAVVGEGSVVGAAAGSTAGPSSAGSAGSAMT